MDNMKHSKEDMENRFSKSVPQQTPWQDNQVVNAVSKPLQLRWRQQK